MSILWYTVSSVYMFKFNFLNSNFRDNVVKFYKLKMNGNKYYTYCMYSNIDHDI